MTGFGDAEAEAKGLSVRVEVRAVNHRFLQVKSRLPSELSVLEPKVEAEVRKHLVRGSVTVTVHVVRAGRADRAVVDGELAARYRALLSELQANLGLTGDLTLETVVQLPGVVTLDAEGEVEEEERELVLVALRGALEALVGMRADEGRRMLDDLKTNATAVGALVERIEARMPEVLAAHHEALRKRLADLLENRPPAAEADLARELALLADRTDVSEEITRLRSHLEQLDTMLAKSGAVGRQLDFLMQELMREANTIGSKCSDAAAAHHVVELKTHIERLREQVQNVE